MIRTIIFFSILWLSLILSIFLYPPFILFIIFPGKGLKTSYIHFVTSAWAKFVLFLAGIKIRIRGRENISSSSNLVIVSNHQSYMDIPVIMAVFPFTISFITKKELLKIPIINFWMRTMDCVFIDRKKIFSSRKIIRRRLSNEEHNPVLIFPEGTRGRKASSGDFKSGGLFEVFEAGKIVQPVRITGSYNIYENKNRIKPGMIGVDIFETLRPEKYRGKDFHDFKQQLGNIIKNA